MPLRRLPLEAQPSFARRFRERFHASVVEVAAAVEDDALDARLLRVRGEELAHLRGLLGLRALERALQVQPARGGQRAALEVVHELRLDPAVRAEDDEARLLGRAADLAADTPVAARAGLGLRQGAHSRSSC